MKQGKASDGSVVVVLEQKTALRDALRKVLDESMSVDVTAAAGEKTSSDVRDAAAAAYQEAKLAKPNARQELVVLKALVEAAGAQIGWDDMSVWLKIPAGAKSVDKKADDNGEAGKPDSGAPGAQSANEPVSADLAAYLRGLPNVESVQERSDGSVEINRRGVFTEFEEGTVDEFIEYIYITSNEKGGVSWHYRATRKTFEGKEFNWVGEFVPAGRLDTLITEKMKTRRTILPPHVATLLREYFNPSDREVVDQSVDILLGQTGLTYNEIESRLFRLDDPEYYRMAEEYRAGNSLFNAVEGRWDANKIDTDPRKLKSKVYAALNNILKLPSFGGTNGDRIDAIAGYRALLMLRAALHRRIVSGIEKPVKDPAGTVRKAEQAQDRGRPDAGKNYFESLIAVGDPGVREVSIDPEEMQAVVQARFSLDGTHIAAGDKREVWITGVTANEPAKVQTIRFSDLALSDMDEADANQGIMDWRFGPQTGSLYMMLRDRIAVFKRSPDGTYDISFPGYIQYVPDGRFYPSNNYEYKKSPSKKVERFTGMVIHPEEKALYALTDDVWGTHYYSRKDDYLYRLVVLPLRSSGVLPPYPVEEVDMGRGTSSIGEIGFSALAGSTDRTIVAVSKRGSGWVSLYRLKTNGRLKLNEAPDDNEDKAVVIDLSEIGLDDLRPENVPYIDPETGEIYCACGNRLVIAKMSSKEKDAAVTTDEFWTSKKAQIKYDGRYDDWIKAFGVSPDGLLMAFTGTKTVQVFIRGSRNTSWKEAVRKEIPFSFPVTDLSFQGRILFVSGSSEGKLMAVRPDSFVNSGGQNASSPIAPAASIETVDMPNPGGIDFRAIPSLNIPAGGLLGLVDLNAPEVLSADARGIWQQMNELVDADVEPDSSQIKLYVSACLRDGTLEEHVCPILCCIARSLRIEEDLVKQTDPELKDLLVALETGGAQGAWYAMNRKVMQRPALRMMDAAVLREEEKG